MRKKPMKNKKLSRKKKNTLIPLIETFPLSPEQEVSLDEGNPVSNIPEESPVEFDVVSAEQEVMSQLEKVMDEDRFSFTGKEIFESIDQMILEMRGRIKSLRAMKKDLRKQRPNLFARCFRFICRPFARS